MKFRVLIILLIASTSVFAQREIGDSPSISDRGYVGLGFGGLSFGSDTYYGKYFSIGVSALAGYMLTENLSTGFGVDYQFTSYNDIGYKNHLYGGFPFVRYNISDFFIQTDYAIYSLKSNLGTTQEARVREERFFVGVGYSPETGNRAQFNLLLSYDLLYDNIGLFPSPIALRAFITFH